ncbi:MAG: response regulator transcription factor [Oscillospiraceae bacterium]|nr:response regulator transcription factor [Oscillospiraceae bacterium]
MANILIIEDDAHVALTVQATLTMAGYGCTVLPDGRDAVPHAASGNYDLILLDVMLPGEDGFTLMEKLQGCDTPVIFLTARQDVLDKVSGLRLGAEDYIVKPFEALELLARIEVVLRRYHKLSGVLTYGDLRADTEKHEVTAKGVPVPLTPKEFDMLVFLMQHVDVAVTREQLLQNVWGFNFMGESRTVDMHIRQLRKKLNLSDGLVTIPKLGYRLESQKTR